MAKRKKILWNSHVRRTYPGQGFYESNAAYRQRKKRGKQIDSFLKKTGKTIKKTGKAIDKLADPKSRTRAISVKRHSHTSTDKSLREQEKVRLLEAAKSEHSKFQEWTSTLSNVLREREKEEFDWDAISSSRGQYQKQEFQPSSPFTPPQEPTEKSVRLDIEVKNSRIIVSLSILAIGIVAFFFNVWVGLLGFVASVAFFIIDQRRLNKICDSKLPAALRRATEKYQQELQAATLEYQLKIEQERTAYGVQETEKQKAWEEDEAARKRIRDSVDNEDLEILEDLLIEELCELTFPVEQEIALCFNQINSVDLEFRLPDLDEIPDEDLSLTKTGKLSRKTMTQKRRLEIFTDLCTGIALRLSYESFRIIDFLDEIRVFGYSQTVDLATGHEEEIYPLLIDVGKSELGELNLDQIDPSTAFNHLGGIFKCDRKGILSHISME
jgi:hypothetical protein